MFFMADFLLWFIVGIVVVHIIGTIMLFEHFSTLMNTQGDMTDKILKHLLEDKQKSAYDDDLGFDITGNEVQQIMEEE